MNDTSYYTPRWGVECCYFYKLRIAVLSWWW